MEVAWGSSEHLTGKSSLTIEKDGTALSFFFFLAVRITLCFFFPLHRENSFAAKDPTYFAAVGRFTAISVKYAYAITTVIRWRFCGQSCRSGSVEYIF